MFAYGLSCFFPIFGEQGIGYALRETAVWFVVELDKVDREMLLQKINDRPGATVACVDNDFQRL